MELTQGKVFYQIFKTSDSCWISQISPKGIQNALPQIPLEEIECYLVALQKEGVIRKIHNGWLIQYVDSRLY